MKGSGSDRHQHEVADSFPRQVGHQPGWPQWGQGQGPNQHNSGRGRRPEALATARAELPMDGLLHLHLLEESHWPGGHGACEGRQESRRYANRELGLLPDVVSSTQGLPLGSTTIAPRSRATDTASCARQYLLSPGSTKKPSLPQSTHHSPLAQGVAWGPGPALRSQTTEGLTRATTSLTESRGEGGAA